MEVEANCGSHLGERFPDGVVFKGTPAVRTGQRYSMNGAGLIFVPSDGSPSLSGEAPTADAVAYWQKYEWRMVDGGLRPI